MSIDKIPEERLFQNNTKEEVIYWGKRLKYFHYMRARGGHNCEGDSFCAYFRFDGLEDLKVKLSLLGVKLNQIEQNALSFDPFQSYSLDDLDNLKMTIAQFPQWEQPRHITIFGNKAHIWVLENQFEISVSGSKNGQTYKVSDEDFEGCLLLERQFDMLGWENITDKDIRMYAHCISPVRYPELFE